MTTAVGRGARWLRWYLREVSGETAYDRYVQHACHGHPRERVLSRRQFERQRMDRRDDQPQSRCC